MIEYFAEESAPSVNERFHIGTSWQNEFVMDSLIVEAIESGLPLIAIIREVWNGGRFEQTATEYYYKDDE